MSDLKARLEALIETAAKDAQAELDEAARWRMHDAPKNERNHRAIAQVHHWYLKELKAALLVGEEPQQETAHLIHPLVASIKTLAEKWHAEALTGINGQPRSTYLSFVAIQGCADELSALVEAAPMSELPTDQPTDKRGRLLLNAYGRQCYDLGRFTALKESDPNFNLANFVKVVGEEPAAQQQIPDEAVCSGDIVAMGYALEKELHAYAPQFPQSRHDLRTVIERHLQRAVQRGRADERARRGEEPVAEQPPHPRDLLRSWLTEDAHTTDDGSLERLKEDLDTHRESDRTRFPVQEPAADPWHPIAKRLRSIYEGFVDESLNGVVCSIPDTGLNTPPHRTWCARCQRRYRELKTLIEVLEAPQLPAPPGAASLKESR